MQTYYHNTTANNPDNVTLLYLDRDGDWAQTKKEFEFADGCVEIVAQVVIEYGVIPGMTIDQYCDQVARIARKALNIN